ncbi:unnamed protein product [Pedinophyceae sp. YPF-701]|nr:unnamed protein product [Pedinophyceae sp. YPF-701]
MKRSTKGVESIACLLAQPGSRSDSATIADATNTTKMLRTHATPSDAWATKDALFSSPMTNDEWMAESPPRRARAGSVPLEIFELDSETATATAQGRSAPCPCKRAPSTANDDDGDVQFELSASSRGASQLDLLCAEDALPCTREVTLQDANDFARCSIRLFRRDINDDEEFARLGRRLGFDPLSIVVGAQYFSRIVDGINAASALLPSAAHYAPQLTQAQRELSASSTLCSVIAQSTRPVAMTAVACVCVNLAGKFIGERAYQPYSVVEHALGCYVDPAWASNLELVVLEALGWRLA